MKLCQYCRSKNDDSAMKCRQCGATEFTFVCNNCGTTFEKGFCPNCGVRAGTQEKTCPKCGEKYFTAACPSCGYTPTRDLNESRNQAEQPSIDVSQKDNKKKKGVLGKVLLWIFFLPIMAIIAIWKTDRLTKRWKIILTVTITVFCVIYYILNNAKQKNEYETKVEVDAVPVITESAANDKTVSTVAPKTAPVPTPTLPPVETLEPAQETNDAPESMTTEAPASESSSADGLRSEFKEAMDSYESYIDEYCDFMIEYKKNSTDLKLLAEYADMLAALNDMNEKFEEWESEDLNDEETQYYLEVQSRVSQKLLTAAQ